MPQIRIYSSFQAAEEADRRYYAFLTPLRRLDLQGELIDRYREAHGSLSNDSREFIESLIATGVDF